MIHTIETLQISASLRKSVSGMGFESLTPVQQQAITPMIEKNDLLVQAPTGTGKTCAFAIPMIQNLVPSLKKVQAVVLCPTRELAKQTADVIRNLLKHEQQVKVLAIYGGEHIQRQINALKRRPQIVVATPGRMIDHMQRRTIRLDHVSCVVLDEADTMLDMGFRDDIHTILEKTPESRQTVLFSATMSKSIRQIAETYQTDVRHIQVKAETKTAEDVTQYYSVLDAREKSGILLELLKNKRYRSCLVFTKTKSGADKLSQELCKKGIRAGALHGDLRQTQRDAMMAKYRSRKIHVLVATDVAARGIDVTKIDAVINYDMPQDHDSYIHRIGRTGRGGQQGVSYTFIGKGERAKLQQLARDTKAVIQQVSLQIDEDAVFQEVVSVKPQSQPSKPKRRKRRPNKTGQPAYTRNRAGK